MSAARQAACQPSKTLTKRAGKDKADQPPVLLENERSLSPETMRQQLEWEEKSKRQKKSAWQEKRKRQELEEIRRAEADQRKARDRARLAEEEEADARPMIDRRC